MQDDTQFQDHIITSVEKHDGGYSVGFDGYGFYVPDVGIEPKVGDTMRQYGKGFGSPVRGVLINGQLVYYRTEAEDKEHHEIEMYGRDAADWLARWDANRGVWSIEMGGLGPGYEQCIQITAAEILRAMLAKPCDAAAWSDTDVWKRDREEIEKTVFEVPAVKALGLSGAQWGGALSLASCLYRDGPRGVMNDERVKDRRIQVQRTFPQAAAA